VDAAGVGRATLCCAALCCAVTECYLLSASLHILAHQQSLHTIPPSHPSHLFPSNPHAPPAPLLQAEAHAQGGWDYSDDEEQPPFKEQLAAAAKRSQGAQQPAGKRTRAR